jgi:DNA repair exonuclease SbcCD ATPase subunit
MKKRRLRDDLEMMANYTDALEFELSDTQQKLNGANAIIAKQIKHIEMLNSQLEQQDKAIERKDKQFEGLKACYKDDLINGRLL